MKVKEITIKLTSDFVVTVYKFRDPEKKEIQYSKDLGEVMKTLFKTRYQLYKHLGLCIDVIHALDLDPEDTFTQNSEGWERFKQYFGFESDMDVYKAVLNKKEVTYKKDEKLYDLCKQCERS